MTTSEFRAIPTEYNGVQYRSRLESDVARLLTVINIPFEYEVKSFLLPSGIHYRPDFRLWGDRVYLEVRGYSSDTGDRQIAEFCTHVASGALGDETSYAVIRDEHPHWSPRFATHEASRYMIGVSPVWSFLLISTPGETGWALVPGYGHPTSHALQASVVDGALYVGWAKPASVKWERFSTFADLKEIAEWAENP